MAAGTSQVTVGNAAYVSLGTGPMLISSPGSLQLVASASQPLANTVGHNLVESYLTPSTPFVFSLAQQVWALAQQPNTIVTVTATS